MCAMVYGALTVYSLYSFALSCYNNSLACWHHPPSARQPAAICNDLQHKSSVVKLCVIVKSFIYFCCIWFFARLKVDFSRFPFLCLTMRWGGKWAAACPRAMLRSRHLNCISCQNTTRKHFLLDFICLRVIASSLTRPFRSWPFSNDCIMLDQKHLATLW